MTNYEKNKALLDMYVAADIPWGVNKDGKVSECNGCTDCIFRKNILGEVSCRRKRLKWLQQEYIYKEPEVEVDWSKVEIDTPILVRNDESEKWRERHFAGCIGGRVCAFDLGDTSKDFDYISPWNYAKLVKED